MAFFSLSVVHLHPQDSANVILKGSLISLKPAIANAIAELRKEMNYPFVIDFLLSHHRNEASLEVLEDADTTEINLEKGFSAKNVVERFRIGEVIYSLLTIKSLSGDRVYHLLVDSDMTAEGTSRLDLFEFSQGAWNFCDSFPLSSRFYGLFEISTLNKHDVINVKMATDATGYYREEEAYLGISKNRFKTLFGFTRIELYQLEGKENSKWRVRKLFFVDLNHDGFVDIVEKTKEEIMNIPNSEWNGFMSKLWLRTKDSEAFYKMRAKKIISEKEQRYIWNEKTNSFDRTD